MNTSKDRDSFRPCSVYIVENLRLYEQSLYAILQQLND
jgi:hypothetical protein